MRPPETANSRPPVVIFAYRRPDHLRRTLAALAANDGASETHVILHSDGPRSTADAAAVNGRAQGGTGGRRVGRIRRILEIRRT